MHTAGLTRLFNPRSIAIVGASPEGPTRNVADNLRGLGYAGALYPVNPRRSSVWDLPAFADVRDVPEAPEFAMIAVGADRVREAVSGSIEAGVTSLMIYTAGMAETGEGGARLQDDIVRLAEAGGATVLGPNCLGFVNVTDRVAVSAFPPQSMPKELGAGTVGLVSQSGGLMISAMELGTRLGLRFSRLLSTGNEADVTSLDCLEYLIEDPATSVIGMVLERVPAGRRLLELAGRAADAGKPVVALRLGRSEAGRRAALTHTASIIGPASEFAAAAASAGIVPATTPAELVSHLMLFGKRRPAAAAQGVAVITMSGGTRVLVADVADDHGLDLAPFGDETRAELADALPDFAAIDNPLDLTPAGVADPAVVDRAIAAVAADDAVGAVVLILHLKNSGGSAVQQGLIRRFCEIGSGSSRQFVVISSIPEGLSGYWSETVAASPVPFLNDLGSIGSLAALQRWQRRVAGVSATPARDAAPAPGPASPAPASPAPASRAWDEADSYRLLESAGIATTPWRAVRTPDDARSAADELGYPVVLKICSPLIPHKSDVGGVVTGIRDATGLAEAWHAIRGRVAERVPGAGAEPMIVQGMAAGRELVVGTTTSADFGPMISVGVGGIWVELLRDVAIRPCPVTADEAQAMLGELRASAVLDGLRGEAPVDRAAVAAVIAAVSELAVREERRVDSIEINPLIAGAAVAAADALVIPHPSAGKRER